MIRRVLVTVPALLVALAAGACNHAVDDEMVPPVVTETAKPAVPQDLPALPVGELPAGKVTVRDTAISVGARRIDVAPLRVDAHVAAAGGVYFVSAGELWFTDLARVRPTPFMEVADVRLAPDRKRLVFTDLEHGAVVEGSPLPLEVEYDAATGRFLRATYAAR